MNQDKIAALKAAAEKATPGPWNKGESNPGKDCVWLDGRTEPKEEMGPDWQWIDCGSENNATFISNANPQAILSMIARLEAAEKNAARYLWLRAQHWNDSAFAVVSEPKRNVKLGTYCPSEDRLDQEIDSAMGADHE